MTKHVHGMHLSFLMGLSNGIMDKAIPTNKLSLNQFLFLGQRSLDPYEKELLKNGVLYNSRDITGGEEIVLPVLDDFINIHKHIHVSLGIEVLDPSIAQEQGTLKLEAYLCVL